MAIKTQTWHKAVIGRLRDPKQLELLFASICKPESINHAIVSSHLHIQYPDDYHQESVDAEDMYNEKYHSFCDIFEDLSKKLFRIYNGNITLKRDYLQDYHLFNTALDTFPFFATALLKYAEVLESEDQRTAYLIANVDETFRIEGNQEKKLKQVIDMHFHLGAALDFSYRVHDIVTNSFQKGVDEKKDLSYEIFLHFFKKSTATRFYVAFSTLESFLCHSIFGDVNPEELNRFAAHLSHVFDENFEDDLFINRLVDFQEHYPSIRVNPDLPLYNHTQTDKVDIELLTLARKYFTPTYKHFDPKNGDKLLILLFDKHFCSLPDHTLLFKLFSAYFMMRNIIKTQLFQQHRRVGFGYFSSYSRGFLKNQSKFGGVYFTLKSLMHPTMPTWLEARTGIQNNAKKVSDFYVSVHKAVTRLNKDKKNALKVRIIHHFIKNSPDNPEKETVRHQSARRRYKKETRHLVEFINSPEYRFHKFDNTLEAESEQIDLAYRYFQGIDTASFEFKVPPEVFGPIYRFFKKSILASGLALKEPCEEIKLYPLNLQYTYHAGEAFRDIISGLRAITEAVIFLELKDEDRLGHAVALAIDPKLFLSERKHVSMSMGEYFDNLIFLYFLLLQSKKAPIKISHIRSLIERLAHMMYNDLYESYALNPEDFIDAWLLRRNCPEQLEMLLESVSLFSDSHTLTKNPYWVLKKYLTDHPDTLKREYRSSFDAEYARFSIPDFLPGQTTEEPLKRYLSAQSNPLAYLIFRHYAVKKSIREYYNTPYDGEAVFEPEVYEYFQDVVMQHFIARRNIIVEILPTSNVLITPIDSFSHHPFLRLYPPGKIKPNRFRIRKNKIKIVFGTDDPGIQATNIIMEMYQIKNVVEKHYGKTIAEEYVSKLMKGAAYLFQKGM